MDSTPDFGKWYARTNGTACPYCDSTNLESHDEQVGAYEYYENWVCLDCDSDWNIIYTLGYFEDREGVRHDA
jgi:hypothetical protein